MLTELAYTFFVEKEMGIKTLQKLQNRRGRLTHLDLGKECTHGLHWISAAKKRQR